MSQLSIATIGHSNRSIEEMLELLTGAKVQTVIDCRSRPRSRWRQFNASILEEYLHEVGIAYEWRGNNIGGLEGNISSASTIDEVAQRTINGERIALMCSEGNPDQCHRGTWLAPEIEKRNIGVVHLLYR